MWSLVESSGVQPTTLSLNRNLACRNRMTKRISIIPKIIEKSSQILPKSIQNYPKITKNRFKNARWPKLEAQSGLKSILEAKNRPKRTVLRAKWSILEAQVSPKSRPRPEKIDVKIGHVFGIVFSRARTWFWKDFW